MTNYFEYVYLVYDLKYYLCNEISPKVFRKQQNETNF